MANTTLTESATKPSVLPKRLSFRRQAAPHAASLAHHRETAPSPAAINRLPADISMKVRPCGCPELGRLVKVTCLSDGHSDGQKSHAKCSTSQRMCNLLQRSYVNSEPNITGAPKKLLFLSAFHGTEQNTREPRNCNSIFAMIASLNMTSSLNTC